MSTDPREGDADGLHAVARLYYTGMGHRRYRRASTQAGPGEPLCFLSVALEAISRLRSQHAAEISRLTAELASWKDAALTAAAGIIERDSELEEARKDAPIHRGGERPSDGWYWMRWHVDGPEPTPWALLNTFAGPMLETTEWVGPLKPPAAAMTQEKPHGSL